MAANRVNKAKWRAFTWPLITCFVMWTSRPRWDGWSRCHGAARCHPRVPLIWLIRWPTADFTFILVNFSANFVTMATDAAPLTFSQNFVAVATRWSISIFFFKVFYTPPSPRSITFHANNMVGESGKKKNSSPWQRYELSVRILWNMARRSISGIPFANLAQRPSNRLPWQRVRLHLLKMALNQCPVTWQWSDHQLICDYFWGAVHAHAVSRAYRSIRTEMKAPDGVAVAVVCGRIRIPPDGSAGRGRQVKKVVRVDKCGS